MYVEEVIDYYLIPLLSKQPNKVSDLVKFFSRTNIIIITNSDYYSHIHLFITYLVFIM